MRIVSVVGTRPHLTKLASVAEAFVALGVEHRIVHSGQHYDPELTGDLVRELQLPTFDAQLHAGRRAPTEQLAYLLHALPEVLEARAAELVLVYGDTTTTAAGALAARMAGFPVGHVEAGLREFTYRNLEELNKRVTDGVSSVFFCPSERAAERLATEGIREGVHVTGDCALDLLLRPPAEGVRRRAAELTRGAHRYGFATCHRAANTESRERLASFCDALARLEMPVVFAVHPRTRAALTRYGLALPGNVTDAPPLPFGVTAELLRGAAVVVTDSGGVTKEAYTLGRPVVLFDDQIEWTEAVEEGWVGVCGADADRALAWWAAFRRPAHHSRPYGDGLAGRRVAEISVRFCREARGSDLGTRAPYRRR